MADNSTTLDGLVGEHVLDGVDTATEQVQELYGDGFEDCSVIRFRLDGTVYTAIEDPSDGYRSSMRDIRVGGEITNAFPPVRVVAMKRPRDKYGDENDALMLVDVVTGKVVLEVGTHNTDDYYPSFVADFRPENMSVNAG